MKELGRGRLGTVYKARQSSLDRVVAIKILRAEALPDGESVMDFRRRVDAAAQVEHTRRQAIVSAVESLRPHRLVLNLRDVPMMPAVLTSIVVRLGQAVDFVREPGRLVIVECTPAVRE